MQEWIETYGTTALKRAFREGYDVVKGIGDHLIDQLIDSLELEWFESWEEHEERTSPTAESFAKRDLVHACVGSISPPVGWTIRVSRISRVTISEDEKITGVLVSAVDDKLRVIRRVAFSFE